MLSVAIVTAKAVSNIGNKFSMKVIIFLTALCVLVLVTLLFMRGVCDLSVEDVHLIPTYPKIGDKVIVSYRVLNRGPCELPKESYQVFITVDDKRILYDASGSPVRIGVFEGVNYSQMKGFSTFTMKNQKNISIKVAPKFLYVIDPDVANNSAVLKIKTL